MKYSQFAAIVVCMFLASCAQEQTHPSNTSQTAQGIISLNVTKTLTIKADNEQSSTKTSLADDYSVLWSEEDAINLMGQVTVPAVTEIPYEVTSNYSTYSTSGTTYSLTNAYDGNESTYFWSSEAQASGKYIQIKFSTPVILKSFSVYSSHSSDMLKTGQYLQVSSDGSSWTDIGAFSGQQRCTFSDINSGEISYARIYAKSSATNWLVVNEIEMEVEAAGEPETSAFSEQFTLESGVGQVSASFTGTISGEISGSVYALYPYSSTATFDGTQISFELPSEQSYAENSFASGANPSIGVLNGESIAFRNLCGTLRLSIKGTQIVTSISVSDNAGKSLWGSVSYPVAEIGTAAVPVDGSSTINLNCGDGVQLQETVATTFNVVVPAGAFSEGLSVSVYTTEGLATISTDVDNTISRSMVRKMPSFTLDNLTPLTDWDRGEEFEIAETLFSKSNTGNKSLVISENTTINDSSLENKAVFVSEGITLTLGSNASLNNTLIICESGKANINASTVNASGIVALEGLKLSSGFSLKSTSLTQLCVDGCDFTLASSGLSLVDMSSNGSSSVTNLSIVGNVFHSSSAATQRTYALAGNCTGVSFAAMNIKNNMFMNVKGYDGALISAGGVGTLTLDRNHFYFGNVLADDFAILKSSSAPTGTATIHSNSYYGATGEGVVSSYGEKAGSADMDPLKTVDIPNGSYSYASPLATALYSLDGETKPCVIDRTGMTASLKHSPAGADLDIYVMPGALYTQSGSWPSSKSFTVSYLGENETYTCSLPDYVSTSSIQSLNSDGSGWTVVWSDEFTGSDWDREVWTRCPQSTPDWAMEQWPDDESLVEISDGTLVTWGKKDSDTSKGNGGYICGGIWGKDLKSFDLGMNVTGRIDIRAKMTYAKGYWPAIWMMPQQDSFTWPQWGEIDIMEHLNSESGYYATLHTSRSSGSDNSCNNGGKGTISQNTWQVFSVIVINDEIRLLVDGKTSHTCKKSDHASTSQTSIEYWMNYWPFDRTEYYMIMDSQLNGGWVGNADGTNLPAHMDIDYVRYMIKE